MKKTVYLFSGDPTVKAGSYLPLSSTRDWGGAWGIIYELIRYDDPTYIPHESALDLSAAGNSKFDAAISSSTSGYHDVVPTDIVEPLLSELGVQTVSPPGPPSDLTIANRNAGMEPVELQWQASLTTGVDYNVYRHTVPDSGSISWEQIGTTSNTTYTDYDVLVDPVPTPDHKDFEYRVSAVNSAGESNYSNVVSIYAFPLGPTEDDSTLASSESAGDSGKLSHTAAQLSTDRPQDFSLKRNYPNPFSSRTNICFEIAEPSNVKITVHDMLGRTVRRLLDRKLVPDSHCVTFEASGLPSGAYLYRINAGDKFSDTGRLVLVR